MVSVRQILCLREGKFCRVQGILEQHTREEADHQSKPTSICQWQASTQEYSQVSQKDGEDAEDGGGTEELVDSIIHDLEQENLEKAVDQVAIEREEQGADTRRTLQDDQNEEVVVEQHDEGILEQHTREEADHQSKPTSICQWQAGTQQYSQVSQKDGEDAKDGGGTEELVDSIIHDLEQENLEKAVDQVAIEREDQGADTQRTLQDDQNEEVVVEQHDEVTEGQHDDEVTEGQHDEDEGQYDDEVTKGQQDDEETKGHNVSNLSGGRRNKLEVFGKILETSTPQAFLERIRVTFSRPPPRIPLCRLVPSEAIRKLAKTNVGELMFSLARLNKMNDYAYVPTTFGDRLFQLRRLGKADKTTLLDGLAIEDRAWVEKEMQCFFTTSSTSCRAFSRRFKSFEANMASHVVGYPRMGPKRELKFALESFWDKKSSASDLEKVAKDLRCSIWKQMSSAGISYIPSNTFSYYDQVLDTTALVGAVPSRYEWTGGEIGFDVYFSMARGNAKNPAMEMTKWFDTNYHYIVPELGPETKFALSSHKVIEEYKEAKELGIETVPVLVGPFSYLRLAKPGKGVEPTYNCLSLIDSLLPVYKEVISKLKAEGASWIQLDEPALVLDLEPHHYEVFKKAYQYLGAEVGGIKILVETYFADIPSEAYKTLLGLKSISGIGVDLVRGKKTLDLIKDLGLPDGKVLFAGVVDGRNIWANDLTDSLALLTDLSAKLGDDKVVISTSCSLLHTAVDLKNESKIDEELKSWLAFAAQKVIEVVALAKALHGNKDEAYFTQNASAQASRRSSPRVHNPTVQKLASEIKNSEHRRATPVMNRLEEQQKHLNLPILPTTSIGSFPQTLELRRVRREFKASKISEEVYIKAIQAEIGKVVKLQEELDIDVLVHGEPERNDMVEYFGEQLKGFVFTENGWVQSYGSRCVKPPIIYGDVSRPAAMTVFWSKYAQSLTKRPMKGMLTGPVTILNWSFVRNDQPRSETCYQIALAIKDEVEDLEAGGIHVIQIDEAALREGLPLRKSEQAHYLNWAVHSFRITNCGVKDTTQIHTHMCYSHFNDIIHSIIDMDADVITIENSRSDEKLLRVFREGVKYGAGIGPGVYDIHSPRIPDTEEIADRIRKMLDVLELKVLWVNPDCGLKTRKYAEVKPALINMVEAAKKIRAELASAK
ncbi:hypothetical protein L7F22_061598 [Adiantum nelumboides]|nr:hypothetical protein [Adiantum nelumboides]